MSYDNIKFYMYVKDFSCVYFIITMIEGVIAVRFLNVRKSEQAHIPHAPTLLENAVYNEWQFQELVTGNLTKKGT